MKKFSVFLVLMIAMAVVAVADDDRGYLGATITSVQNHGEGEEDNGIYIEHPIPGGAAAEAGLESEDRIVAIDGAAVNSLRQLKETLAGSRIGKSVNVTIERGGRERDVNVRLAAMPDGHTARFGVVVEEKRAYFGVEIEELNPQLAEYFGVEGGILITKVIEDGPAEHAGLQAGDVVVEVDGNPVRNMKSLQHAMHGIEPGDEVAVVAERRGAPVSVFVEAGDRASHTINIDMLRLHEHLEANEDGNVEIVLPDDGRWELHRDKEHNHHHPDHDHDHDD